MTDAFPCHVEPSMPHGGLILYAGADILDDAFDVIALINSSAFVKHVTNLALATPRF